MILTSLVVERNDWARALVGRPGVHVAGGPQAVLDLVDQLIGGACGGRRRAEPAGPLLAWPTPGL